MRPFLLREDLGQLESLRGYAPRMAALNECSSLVSPQLISLSAMSEALDAVALLTATDRSILANRMSQQSLGRGRVRVGRLGLTSVGHKAVRWQERCVCPACVGEGVLSSVLWELEAYMACCMHGLMLTSRCDACRRPLRWSTAPLDVCSCGRSLADLETSKAPVHEVELSLHLRACAVSSLGRSIERELPDQGVLPEASLDAFLLFLEFACCALVPMVTFAWSDVTNSNAALRTARQIVSDVVVEPWARHIMCGRTHELPPRMSLDKRQLTERDLVEMNWMFAGIQPPDQYPMLDLMASRRQRWQAIAPALVIAERDEGSIR